MSPASAPSPRDHPANGEQLRVKQNEALFSLDQYTFGNTASSQFAVPNLHGEAPAALHEESALEARSPHAPDPAYVPTDTQTVG